MNTEALKMKSMMVLSGAPDSGKVLRPTVFDIARSLGHTVIIGPTQVGMSNTLNPFSNTKEDLDFTMALLVRMHGGQVEEGEETKAREVLVAESTNKSDLCLLDIVEAFERTPELQEFAGRLRHYALPGAFGKLFSPEAGRHLSVEDVAELRLTDEEVSRIKSKQN